MMVNDDWFGLVGNKVGDVFIDDWLMEYNIVKDIVDGVVWVVLYFFEVKFFDVGFIGGDGCIFYVNVMFVDCMGCVDGDLVFGVVVFFDFEVVVV